MIKTILVDVDGVIADFTSRAITALVGSEKMAEIYASWPEGEWDISTVIGVDRKTFWKTIDTPDVWGSILPFGGAHKFMYDLVEYANSHGVDDIMFATSSGGSLAFPAARTAWLREFCEEAKIPQLPVIIFQHVIHKAIGANYQSMIIEDNDLAVDAFREKGGHAVLIPRLGNKGVAPVDGDVYSYTLESVKLTIIECQGGHGCE